MSIDIWNEKYAPISKWQYTFESWHSSRTKKFIRILSINVCPIIVCIGITSNINFENNIVGIEINWATQITLTRRNVNDSKLNTLWLHSSWLNHQHRFTCWIHSIYKDLFLHSNVFTTPLQVHVCECKFFQLNYDTATLNVYSFH